jgi:hypothetical protein
MLRGFNLSAAVGQRLKIKPHRLCTKSKILATNDTNNTNLLNVIRVIRASAWLILKNSLRFYSFCAKPSRISIRN